MSGIFISYRRDDSQALAGRLCDRLTQRFGKDRVFRDIDAIDPGAKFSEVITERIGDCDALIALIGNGWLEAKDAEGRRRLDRPHDLVKAEIAAALAQNKLVIPALIEGTPMPARESLPEELAPLADRNALPISDSRFDFDVGRLISTIDKVLAPGGSTPAPTVTPRRTGLWARLSEARTQRTLAFVGAGIAAVVGATWTAYTHLSEKQKPFTPTVSAATGGIAAGGNVAATAAQGGVAVVATGPVTIGITLEQYEEQIKKREREVREEFTSTSRANKDRIALLEKQLAAAEALARSPETGFEKYKEVLASTSRSLEQLAAKVSAEELDSAREGLARGDTTEAERLLRKGLGPDKAGAAKAAYQLGQLAESRIDYATAAKYYGEAANLQPENPQYLSAAGQMDYTLGRYGDAEPLFEQALAISKKALGAEHPDVATSLTNFALLYSSQGLYPKAEPLYKQALAILKKTRGAEHPDVATGLTNLADLYRAQGLYARAEPLYQQGLAIRKKTLGPEQPDVAASLNNLALLYSFQGLYGKAEPLYQQALAILKKTRGADHPDVATGLTNLADLYRDQGLYLKAEPLYQQGLAIRKKALGLEHPNVAISVNNLAALYYSQGLYGKAEPLYQQALAIWKKAFGAEHPDVATSLTNLALLYSSQGLYPKAEPLYQQALAIRKKVLGPEHPDVALSLNNLALLYYSESLYAKAEPLYQQSIAIWKKALGAEHPHLAASLNNLAELYRVQGLYAKAEPLFHQALAIRKKVLGPEHPDVALSLNNQALLYYSQGLYAKAEPLYQQSLAIWMKAFGAEHPNVATGLENYAELLTRLKRDKHAADLRMQAIAIRARLASK